MSGVSDGGGVSGGDDGGGGGGGASGAPGGPPPNPTIAPAAPSGLTDSPPVASNALHHLHPEGWAPPVGYAHGIAATGRLVVTAGQVGWDPATCTFATDDVGEQTAQALRNVVAVLRAAGAEPAHLVRLTWYVTSRTEYLAALKPVGAAYRELFADHYPAMSAVIVAGLVEEGAKVEIEATAVV